MRGGRNDAGWVRALEHVGVAQSQFCHFLPNEKRGERSQTINYETENSFLVSFSRLVI